MATIPRSSKSALEEREKQVKLRHRYENRITIARHGKESLDCGDYGNALKKFSEYLSIIAEIKQVREIYDIKINMFDAKNDLTEMFMISQILFEMARLYDAVPKFQPNAQKCLDLFVLLTANQPYQVVNSELVRKALKRSSFKNTEMFRNSYQQIYVQSKKCYIVTFCYGDEHHITSDCRKFKNWLLKQPCGELMVRAYYQISSRLIPVCEENFWLRHLARSIAKPSVFIFSKTLLPAVIKKC
jgi:hypothetical protein